MAEVGNDAVGGMVETIGRINESSKRIADITGLIDGIAFHTNILALNDRTYLICVPYPISCASVALIARQNDIKANLLFKWRRQYLQCAYGLSVGDSWRYERDKTYSDFRRM